jgi:ADP-ribosyl-[dinitrogen reductase] hydrolase
MSGSAGDDLDAREMAARLARYHYLMPAGSLEMAAKMQSGTPAPAGGEAEAEDTALMREGPPPLPVWSALTRDQARDRALGCLLGLAVGDAAGAAVEFKPRDSFPEVAGMTGGGPFNLKPGEWTDDTTMALCLAESLLEAGTVDLDDFMERLRGWLERGENTVPGRCFDIGATTRAAIDDYIATGDAAAGRLEPSSAGNGSLVRLAPVAIFAAGDPNGAEFLALKQSRATHAHPECLDACKLLIAQLLDALDGADKDAATRQRVMALSPKLLFISAGEWRTKTREQISSSGYVVNTLEAALWSVWQTDNFRDAVLTAANLGDDADSVAAVAGQLAGALYGAASIPAEWLEKLAWRPKIETLANDLFDRGIARR